MIKAKGVYKFYQSTLSATTQYRAPLPDYLKGQERSTYRRKLQERFLTPFTSELGEEKAVFIFLFYEECMGLSR